MEAMALIIAFYTYGYLLNLIIDAVFDGLTVVIHNPGFASYLENNQFI